MRNIKFNGKALKLTEDQVRVLRMFHRDKFAAKLKGDFVTGTGRNMNNIIHLLSASQLSDIGVRERYSVSVSDDPRVRKFAADHPRATYAITADKRRAMAILKALQGGVPVD